MRETKDEQMATRKKEIPIEGGKSEGSKVKSAGKTGSASQTAVGAESEPEAGAQAEPAKSDPATAAPEGELEALIEERDELADSLLRLRAKPALGEIEVRVGGRAVLVARGELV